MEATALSSVTINSHTYTVSHEETYSYILIPENQSITGLDVKVILNNLQLRPGPPVLLRRLLTGPNGDSGSPILTDCGQYSLSTGTMHLCLYTTGRNDFENLFKPKK